MRKLYAIGDLYVNVPEPYRRLGFSGLFHLEINTPPEHREAMRATAPRILPTQPGWMLLEVKDNGKAVMVRKDAGAIVDLFFGVR